MKYRSEIVINRNIHDVITLFDNPDNLDKWMQGLESFEPISGAPGQPGSKSLMLFKMGNRKIEMVETIINRNLPEEFVASYEAKGVYNIVRNRFEKISDDKTLYITEHEFRFTGFMKFIAWLMPGAFKKQSMKYLKDFKAFAEGEDDQ